MLRRCFLLLALLPALCLGLIGHGRGMVLCQEACGCVALEMAHDGAGGRHAHAACSHALPAAKAAACPCGHDHDDHDEGKASGCRDIALEAGDHVSPSVVKLPDLTAYPCGHFVLAWFAPVGAQVPLASVLSPQASWRGPPQREPSLPQVLACVRSVVRVI